MNDLAHRQLRIVNGNLQKEITRLTAERDELRAKVKAYESMSGNTERKEIEYEQCVDVSR